MEETTTSTTLENVSNALNDRLTAMEAKIAENEGNIASLGLIAFFGIAAASLTALAFWTAIDNDRTKHRQLEGRVERLAEDVQSNVYIANDNWEKVSRREKTLARTLEIVGGKKTEKAFEKAVAVADINEDDYNPFKKVRQPRKW